MQMAVQDFDSFIQYVIEFSYLIEKVILQILLHQNQHLQNIFEPGHEKTCLMSYANNKCADQPAHPRSLISAFVVRCLDSVMSLVSVTKISILMLAPVADQAGLSLTWSETPEDTFSHDEAHIKKNKKHYFLCFRRTVLLFQLSFSAYPLINSTCNSID